MAEQKKTEYNKANKRIGVFTDRMGEYSRGVIRGFMKYLRPSKTWIVHVEGLGILSVRRLIEAQVDGLIGQVTEKRINDLLKESGIPYIDVADALCDQDVYKICPDNYGVGKMAAEYFLEKGYVNFAMLSAGGYHFATLRQDGFEAKLAEHNYQPYIFKQKMLAYYEHEVVGGHSNLLNGWLKTLPLPIGIFACNDGLAMILNEACRQVGLTVGQDIAIIGVDNDENVCYMEYPPLSSIDLPTLTIGFKAGEMLDKLMNSEQIHEKQIFLKPKVVITRQSSEIMAVKDNDVKEAVLFINKNVAKSITVTDVCDEVCISKRSLEKKFKMALGYSPGHQILITHVRQAKQLLIETNNAVSTIAQMSGFNSPERMCVMFKKVIGLSPTNFRKQFMKF